MRQIRNADQQRFVVDNTFTCYCCTQVVQTFITTTQSLDSSAFSTSA